MEKWRASAAILRQESGINTATFKFSSLVAGAAPHLAAGAGLEVVVRRRLWMEDSPFLNKKAEKGY